MMIEIFYILDTQLFITQDLFRKLSNGMFIRLSFPFNFALLCWMQLAYAVLHNLISLIILLFAGMCPLHMAAWAGKEQIVKTLLENKALVNLPSFSGETPLLLASQHGYANVVSQYFGLSFDLYPNHNTKPFPVLR